MIDWLVDWEAGRPLVGFVLVIKCDLGGFLHGLSVVLKHTSFNFYKRSCPTSYFCIFSIFFDAFKSEIWQNFEFLPGFINPFRMNPPILWIIQSKTVLWKLPQVIIPTLICLQVDCVKKYCRISNGRGGGGGGTHGWFL